MAYRDEFDIFQFAIDQPFGPREMYWFKEIQTKYCSGMKLDAFDMKSGCKK